MPRFKVPVDLELSVRAEEPSHAYGILQVWFNALLSGDFDKFLQMRQDGTISPISWQINEEEFKEVMVERIEAQHDQKQLDEQRLNWKIDETGRRLVGEEE